MGWKAVKDYFGLHDKLVWVSVGEVLIGDDPVPMIIVLNDGTVTCAPDLSIEWLNHYVAMRQYKAKLAELIAQPDTFTASLPVFTFDHNGNIIEKQCEHYTNMATTHDGRLMSISYYFPNRADAAQAAIKQIERRIDAKCDEIASMEEDIKKEQLAIRELRDKRQQLQQENKA